MSDAAGEPLAVAANDGTLLAARVYRRPNAPVRLVVSHGNGMAGHGYRVFWEALARRFEVVVVDMRGHGESEPGPPAHHRWDWFTSDLQCLCQALAAQDPRPLIGAFHSLSAVTSLLHLHGRGADSPWAALALFDPPLAAPAGHPLRALHEAEMDALAGAALRRQRRYAHWQERAAQFERAGIFGTWAAGAPADMARATLREAGDGWLLRCDPEREANIYLGNHHAQVWDVLARPPCPVRLVAADPWRAGAQSPARVSQFAHQATGIGYEAVAGTGHFLQLEQPAACRAALLGFIDDALPGRLGPHHSQETA